MFHSSRPAAALAVLVGFAGIHLASAADAPTPGVTLNDEPGKVRIEIDGSPFAEYCYTNTSRPYLFPVLTADQVLVARRWPLQDSADEEHDHPHHRSLWYAHGDVNGVDFWSESAQAGTTVHGEFLAKQSGPDRAVLSTRNYLIAKNGKQIGTLDLTLRVYRRSADRLFDFDATFRATDGPLKLGDTKEGAMAIRLAETMRLKPNSHYTGQPGGHIVNSEGVRDGATWGKRAKWVDYYGPVGGKTVGVAIFDHPDNPRYPTWWHVRDYGLFAANPFGIHDFERKPAGTGDLEILAGASLTFRYRFLIHPGDEKDGQVALRYEEYVKEPVQP